MGQPKAYALSPEFCDRVEDAVERAEATYRNKRQPKPRSGRPTDVNIQKLKVTSATPTGTVDGVDYYPCRPQLWAPDTASYTDIPSFDSAVVFDPDNPGFASGDLVDGRKVGSASISGTAWPTFVKMASTGGGGTTKVLRIVDTYTTDPAITGPCWYPAVIQKSDTTAPGIHDTVTATGTGICGGTIVQPNAYVLLAYASVAIYPPLCMAAEGSTPVACDGTAFVTGVRGDNNQMHSGLPVYISTNFGAIYTLACVPVGDPPVATPSGVLND